LFAGAVFSPVAYPLRQDMVPGFFGAALDPMRVGCAVSFRGGNPAGSRVPGRTDREKNPQEKAVGSR